MPSCEKCWSDAHCCDDVAAEYSRLIDTRDQDGHICTPEEQAGTAAEKCPRCSRTTMHQWCHECMACGYKGAKP
jgi:hypothetical protein